MPHDMPGRKVVAERLLREDYAGIDSLLNGFQREFEAGQRSDRDVRNAFQAFLGHRRDLQRFLDEWVRRYPRSYAARVARGFHRSGRGYMLRTYSRAADVPAERWPEIREAFDCAREDLDEALTLTGSPSLAWSGIFQMGMVIGGVDDELSVTALRECPTSLVVRLARARALRREWGGSDEALAAFVAAEAPKLSPEDRPHLEACVPFFRAHYVSHFDNDLEHGLKVVREAIRRYPTANGYYTEGSILSLMKQDVAAIAAFRRSLARDGGDDSARGSIASLFIGMGKRAEAEAELAEAVLWGDPYAIDVAQHLGTRRGARRDRTIALATPVMLAALGALVSFFFSTFGAVVAIVGAVAAITLVRWGAGWRPLTIAGLVLNVFIFVLSLLRSSVLR